MDAFYCQICKINCRNISNYNSHLDGAQHRKKLVTDEMLNNHAPTLNLVNELPPFFCALCRLNCFYQHSFQQHVQGKQHAKKVKELIETRDGDADDYDADDGDHDDTIEMDDVSSDSVDDDGEHDDDDDTIEMNYVHSDVESDGVDGDGDHDDEDDDAVSEVDLDVEFTDARVGDDTAVGCVDVGVGDGVEFADVGVGGSVGVEKILESRGCGEGDVRCYAILARHSPKGRAAPPYLRPTGFLDKVVQAQVCGPELGIATLLPIESFVTPANPNHDPPRNQMTYDGSKGLIHHWKRLGVAIPSLSLDDARKSYRATCWEMRRCFREHRARAAQDQRVRGGS